LERAGSGSRLAARTFRFGNGGSRRRRANERPRYLDHRCICNPRGRYPFRVAHRRDQERAEQPCSGGNIGRRPGYHRTAKRAVSRRPVLANHGDNDMSSLLDQLAGTIEAAGPGLLSQLGAGAALVNAGATNPNFNNWQQFPAPVQPTPQSTSIAQAVLSGTLPVNPVGGATVFGNPSSPNGTPSIFATGSKELSNFLNNGLDIGGTIFSTPMAGPSSTLNALVDGGSPGTIYAAQNPDGAIYAFQSTPSQDQSVASMFPTANTMGDAWNSFFQQNGQIGPNGEIVAPNPDGFGNLTIAPLQGSPSQWQQ
jgi:hypothetical protein